MSSLIASIKREAVLVGAAVLAFVEASTAHGSTLSVAIQGAIPLAVGVLVRSLVTPTSGTPSTPTQEEIMADLTALKQSVSDLTAVTSQVQGVVTELRAEASPQADVDAVTSAVQSASATLQAAVAPPAA